MKAKVKTIVEFKFSFSELNEVSKMEKRFQNEGFVSKDAYYPEGPEDKKGFLILEQDLEFENPK